MKPVKAWEALKAWQEEGRMCRPASWNAYYEQPTHWTDWHKIKEWELEPPKPQVVEFECRWVKDGEFSPICPIIEVPKGGVAPSVFLKSLLNGKHWRVTCTEIVDG